LHLARRVARRAGEPVLAHAWYPFNLRHIWEAVHASQPPAARL
jgi:hypothetical protein